MSDNEERKTVDDYVIKITDCPLLQYGIYRYIDIEMIKLMKFWNIGDEGHYVGFAVKTYKSWIEGDGGMNYSSVFIFLTKL